MTTPEAQRRRARRVIYSFVAMCCSFVAALLVFAYVIHENRNLARQGHEAHAAICTLKADYRTRIRQGKRFLRDHPSGIPGIKVGVIRAAVTNETRTLNALRPVHCRPTH